MSNCGSNANTLVTIEQQARNQKVGVWADPYFVMLWDFRRGTSSSQTRSTPTPAIAPATTLSTSRNLPACTTSDCDCGDFSNWQQAQEVLATYPEEPFKLDGDGDGEACESLQ